MDHCIETNPLAYSYPLLLKNLLFSPIAYDPDREICYQGQRRHSYAQFLTRVARLAGALKTLGVRPGDTVAVMDWDSHRYLECYFAIPMIGAVLHTINLRLPAEQLVYTMDHAEDSLVLVHEDFLPLLESIRGRLSSVKTYVLLSEGNGPAPDTKMGLAGEYEALLESAEPCTEWPDFDENSRATVFYSTGTTGLPKGVSFSHRQLVLHTLAACASLNANPRQGNFHGEDIYMPITPMFHVHAWGIPYLATFMGVKQVYPGKYIPAKLLKLIQDEGVSFSHCVPTILQMLLRDPAAKDIDLSGWKVVIGGSSLPKALCLEALGRGIDVFAGYGMSETCPIVALTRLSSEDLGQDASQQSELRVRTGRPIGLVQAQVVDKDGAEVPHNDRAGGEIRLRAPWLVQAYHKDHLNSERLWEGGWLRTQDLAAVDGRGSLRITDRLKDVIKVGGEWISSLEMEDILLARAGIRECAVVGKGDAKWGEIPLAFVVKAPDAELSQHRVVEHLKDYIGKGLLCREAVLTEVRFIESLPKTSVGKIDKLSLRSLA